MIKVLKMASFFMFMLFTVVNTSKAAFPKDKIEKSTSNTVNLTKVTTENAVITEAELQKDLVTLKNETTNSKAAGNKSKIVAALLAFFLGGFGVHSFYMGNNKKGFIQLGITVLGLALIIAGIASLATGTTVAFTGTVLIGYLLLLGVGIWAFVDFIRILTGGLAPEEGFKD